MSCPGRLFDLLIGAIAAAVRLAEHVLIEQRDEREGANRRYFSEHSVALLRAGPEEVAIPELAAG